jgi:hypothetical protein
MAVGTNENSLTDNENEKFVQKKSNKNLSMPLCGIVRIYFCKLI